MFAEKTTSCHDSCLYADDFLHLSNDTDGYAIFRLETFKVSIDPSEYIEELLVKIDMASSHVVAAPITGRLSSREKGVELSLLKRGQIFIPRDCREFVAFELLGSA